MVTTRTDMDIRLGMSEEDMCRQCLDAVGSLRLVFALWREARFVRLSVAHKWHLIRDTNTYGKKTMCNRAWGI